MAKTLYDILEVSPAASPETIQAAYRSLITRYHPDKVAGLGEDLRALAAQRAAEINQAYETLRKPESRAAYDQQIAVGKPVAAAAGPQPEWQPDHSWGETKSGATPDAAEFKSTPEPQYPLSFGERMKRMFSLQMIKLGVTHGLPLLALHVVANAMFAIGLPVILVSAVIVFVNDDKIITTEQQAAAFLHLSLGQLSDIAIVCLIVFPVLVVGLFVAEHRFAKQATLRLDEILPP